MRCHGFGGAGPPALNSAADLRGGNLHWPALTGVQGSLSTWHAKLSEQVAGHDSVALSAVQRRSSSSLPITTSRVTRPVHPFRAPTNSPSKSEPPRLAPTGSASQVQAPNGAIDTRPAAHREPSVSVPVTVARNSVFSERSKSAGHPVVVGRRSRSLMRYSSPVCRPSRQGPRSSCQHAELSQAVQTQENDKIRRIRINIAPIAEPIQRVSIGQGTQLLVSAASPRSW